MLTIAFLQDNHNHQGYTSASLGSGGVGGTESSVIYLARSLAARGHRVYSLNRMDAPVNDGGVHWTPLQRKKSLPPVDVAIGINSARVFSGLRFKSAISWLHNPPSNRQQLKRRHLWALIRHRPHAVVLGPYQNKLLSEWLPYGGRSIIAHGIAAPFFLRTPEHTARRPVAIFTSQPKRSLDFVIETWREIHGAVPDAELHVFCPQAKEEEAARAISGAPGVIIRGSVSRTQLAAELCNARVMLVPGVADETFCLAAAEATASGVPIVTRGIGALSERVRHGENGFLCPLMPDFASQSISLLTRDDLWMRMHLACVQDLSLKTWDQRAEEWERLFAQLL